MGNELHNLMLPSTAPDIKSKASEADAESRARMVQPYRDKIGNRCSCRVAGEVALAKQSPLVGLKRLALLEVLAAAVSSIVPHYHNTVLVSFRLAPQEELIP